MKEKVNDRGREIRAYAHQAVEELIPYNIRPKIQAITFEIKLVMFQMLQEIGKFHRLLLEDPPTSKVNFCELVTHFNSKELIGLFPCSMRDCAESWLNTLAPETIDSLNSLVESFLIKYFSPTINAWLKNEIVSFQPFEDETLSEALERFKEILRKCHRHGLPIISK